MDGAPAPDRPILLTTRAAALARFVSLEGGEGVGKSTQLDRLIAFLEARGERVVRTREPGGSEGAEAIRTLVVDGASDRWSAASELFLFLAARHDHLERTVRPALAEGAWVVTDRFWDSTRVYQGLVGGLELAAIDDLHERWLAPFRPAMTVVLDLPAEVGLARAAKGRFEAKGLTFHARVRQAFLDLAGLEPERFAVVDASGPKEAVARAVEASLAQHLLR